MKINKRKRPIFEGRLVASSDLLCSLHSPSPPLVCCSTCPVDGHTHSCTPCEGCQPYEPWRAGRKAVGGGESRWSFSRERSGSGTRRRVPTLLRRTSELRKRRKMLSKRFPYPSSAVPPSSAPTRSRFRSKLPYTRAQPPSTGLTRPPTIVRRPGARLPGFERG